MNSRLRRWRGVLATAAWVATVALPPAGAGTYTIDPRDTTATFDVRFLGLFPLRGKFLRSSGTLVYDRTTRQGSIEVNIDTTTLVADNAKAQALARGPEFFAVDRYPSIEFKSSRFVFDETRLKFIEGQLSLVGNTQPVVLTVTDSRCEIATDAEPAHCHASAELVIKRSDFGMKSWTGTVSEEVTIRIVISARQAGENEAHQEPAMVSPKGETPPPNGGRPATANAPAN